MAGAFVVSTTEVLGANGGTTATPIDTSGANLLIVMIADYGAGSGGTLSDSKSNMWNALTVQMETSNSTRGRLYYAENAVVDSAQTFTYTGTGIYAAIGVMAFSGALTSSAFDQQNGDNTDPDPAGTTMATGSVTPSEDGEILVAGISLEIGPNTISVDSSFTGLIQVNHGVNNEGLGMSYLIQTTAGAVDPTFSWSTNSQSAAVIATFKISTSPPPPAGAGVFRSAIIGSA